MIKKIVKIEDLQAGDIILGMCYDSRDLTQNSCFSDKNIVFYDWSNDHDTVYTHLASDTRNIAVLLYTLVTYKHCTAYIRIDQRLKYIGEYRQPHYCFCEILRMID